MTDAFWISKLQHYTVLYLQFHKSLEGLGLEAEAITTLWQHFYDSVCDCPGCREENECVLHFDISFNDDDEDEDAED